MDLSVALIRTTLNATAALSPLLAGRAAFAVFRRPVRRSRLRPEERELHAAAAVERIEVHGTAVTTYRWGDGARPVLLLHGWRSRASRYAALIPRLRVLGLTVVTFDAPGHGESAGRTVTVLDYREAIRQLHDRHGPFEAVVAHSLAVPAAVLALRDTAKAERLVAIAGPGDFDLFPRAFSAGLGLGGWAVPELRRRITAMLPPGLEYPGLSPVHRPEELALPVLLVHDEDDRVIPYDQSGPLHAAYEPYGARLLTTRGLGHNRVLTEPAVLDNVLGFLSEPLPAEPLPTPTP
ncbi:alpha/beta fold hydrolase [Kitasatospora sp. NPDC051853]|uniref:alpha/beta fold hydrolase n=1 Tax=Kitasatospora sp. NPDC051853 TaxID=3364058 RepID=UPI00379A07BA